MTVNLHIERLVVEGLPLGAHEGPRLAAAIEAELARLIGESGPGRDFGPARIEPLVRASATIGPIADADGLGAQIGQAIYGGIAR